MQVTITFLNELVDRLLEAAKANLQTRGRRGSVVHLGPEDASEVLVAGDLHGNRTNYNKILRAANLDAHPNRHLVLQEVVHGGPTYPNGGCMSHIMLEDVAALKVKYPDRFHFLVCNHELGQVLGTPLLKSGASQNQLFDSGLVHAYGPAAARIAECYAQFVLSCPLAVRLRTGVFISHSVPEKKEMKEFDPRVFARELERADFEPGGSAYRLVWGRDHDAEHIRQFATLVRSTALVNGHEPTPAGFQSPNPHQIIFDASGPECYLCVVPANRKVTAQDLAASLVKLG